MKGKKIDLSGDDCGIARALDAVGDRWSLLIIREGFYGHQRFGEIQKSLGLAKNILSSRLKKLVEERVFTIEPDPASALSHRYVLAPKGQQLFVVLIALWQWGAENCFEQGELEWEVVDKASAQPVTKLQVQSQDGRILTGDDFSVVPRDLARVESAA